MGKWEDAIQRLRNVVNLEKGHYSNMQQQRAFIDSKGGGGDIYTRPAFPYNILRIGTIDNPFIDDSVRGKTTNLPNSNTPINPYTGMAALMPGYHPGGWGVMPAMFAKDIYPYFDSASDGAASSIVHDLSSNGSGKLDQLVYMLSGTWPTGIQGAYINSSNSNKIPYQDEETVAGSDHLPEKGQTVVYAMLEGGIPFILGNIDPSAGRSNTFNPAKVLGANLTKSNQNNTNLKEGARDETSISATKDMADIRALHSNIAGGITGSDENQQEIKVNNNTCNININLDGNDEFIEISIQSGEKQNTSKIRIDGDTIYSYTQQYTIEAEDYIEMFAGERNSHVLMNKTNIIADIGKSEINMMKDNIIADVNKTKINMTTSTITMDASMIYQNSQKSKSSSPKPPFTPNVPGGSMSEPNKVKSEEDQKKQQKEAQRKTEESRNYAERLETSIQSAVSEVQNTINNAMNTVQQAVNQFEMPTDIADISNSFINPDTINHGINEIATGISSITDTLRENLPIAEFSDAAGNIINSIGTSAQNIVNQGIDLVTNSIVADENICRGNILDNIIIFGGIDNVPFTFNPYMTINAVKNNDSDNDNTWSEQNITNNQVMRSSGSINFEDLSAERQKEVLMAIDKVEKLVQDYYDLIHVTIPNWLKQCTEFMQSIDDLLFILDYTIRIINDDLNDTKYVTAKQLENDIGQLKITAILEKEKLRNEYDDNAELTKQIDIVNMELMHKVKLYTTVLYLLRQFESDKLLI